MSPQQIQFLKLLRVPTVEMETRIKEEMEINPALEYDTEQPTDDIYDNDYEDREMDSVEDVSLQESQSDQVDIDDYLRNESDDGSYDYNGEPSEKPIYNSARYEQDFHGHLLEQLYLLDLDETDTKIAEQVIGSINDDGYLSRKVSAIVDDLAFGQSVATDENAVERIIRIVQTFDPPGIAAYTLQECLLLQLKRLPAKLDAVRIATDIIMHQYDQFIKKHYDKIRKKLQIDEVEFKQAMAVILKLNPKPGGTFESSNAGANYILPDFFIENNEGNLEIMLNAKNAPELRISRDFRDMLDTYDKGNKKDKKNTEAVQFIKQKLDAAQWFINSIKQRQSTLMQTMSSIVHLQKDFFLTGDETMLKPMILKDVAEMTDLDVSTVSRVANSKYVQTQFGTYPLKHFFSEKITMENGEEVTNKEIKSILSDIVSGEDKSSPLRDEDITEMLAKKGYNISRRTVAKYREQLMIPVARLRKA